MPLDVGDMNDLFGLVGTEKAYRHFETPFLLNKTEMYRKFRNIQIRYRVLLIHGKILDFDCLVAYVNSLPSCCFCVIQHQGRDHEKNDDGSERCLDRLLCKL